jgi:ABC-2 type transport system permease protein
MGVKKYWQLTRMAISEASFYRLMAVNTLLSSVIVLVLYYFLWSAIADSGTLTGGFQRAMSYIVVGQIISSTVFMGTERFVGEKIRRGTIVNELKRPLSFFAHTYFHELGWSLFGLITKAVPIAAIGYIFLNLSFPDLVNGVLFAISLFLSFNLVVLFAYSVSMLIFWTKVEWSLRMMRSTLQNLFSGVLFPLYLLPPVLKPVFDALPFQSMADGPIQIFLMNATGTEAIKILCKQFIWILILFVIAHLMWRKAKTKLTVQGG